MFGAYELGGLDPTGLGDSEKKIATALLRSIIRSSPPKMTLTQYYIHRKNPLVTVQARGDKRSSVVSKRREIFLQNKRELYSSKIYFLPELPFAHDLTTFKSFDFIQNLFSFPISKEARDYIKTRISERESILVYKNDVKETASQLQEEMQTHLARLDLTSFNNIQLSANELWGVIKSLHTFDFDHLVEKNKPPLNNINSRIFDSNITPVRIGGTDYLKISGIKPVYLRIASVKGFSDDYINEATFASGINSPVSVKGNYVLMTRYRGLSKNKQDRYFRSVQDEVQRNQTNPLDLISGNTKSAIEQQLMMSDRDKNILNEIQHAMSLADYHGRYESSLVVFGENIDEINKTCKDMRASLNQSGVDILWESAGLDAAFESFLPGSQFESKREMVVNSTKAAALSLYYKSSEGIKNWEYKTSKGGIKEEAFYIFESNDGTPFYYTPYIGGKCMTIGIGPIRSGKTFLKNTLATHFMKYGGFYTAVDIDPGTEAVAKFFQDDGAIFRLDNDFESGFNPFSIARGNKDREFKAHFLSQIEFMVRSNNNEEMQRFTRAEQKQIDDALEATLDLPKNMQNFSSFLDHCNDDIKAKLSRFSGNGMYARIYDNETDAIGSLTKMVSVYNIMGVKNDNVSLPLVMSEIVFRVLSRFENVETRDLLKLLDIDEGHSFLSIPGSIPFLVKGMRTWGKWNGGVSIWTQSPVELQGIKEWSALRSAASTFWFMADGEMDREIYREVFGLSEGHLDAIESLLPKQQAFVYQPEVKIAKIINLHAEPEQRVINTSVAGEAMTFDKNVQKFSNDIDKAIQETIKELNF